MRLIKLEGQDGPIWLNPEHVVAVRKAVRDTKVETVSGVHLVKDAPEVVARLLGAEELQIDVTPGITYEPGR